MEGFLDLLDEGGGAGIRPGAVDEQPVCGGFIIVGFILLDCLKGVSGRRTVLVEVVLKERAPEGVAATQEEERCRPERGGDEGGDRLAVGGRESGEAEQDELGWEDDRHGVRGREKEAGKKFRRKGRKVRAENRRSDTPSQGEGRCECNAIQL